VCWKCSLIGSHQFCFVLCVCVCVLFFCFVFFPSSHHLLSSFFFKLFSEEEFSSLVLQLVDQICNKTKAGGGGEGRCEEIDLCV